MEPNIKMNPLYRVLGLIISVFLMSSLVFIDYSGDVIPQIVFTIIILLTIVPVCIKGYISGQLLDRLPLFLVNLIKGKPPSYK